MDNIDICDDIIKHIFSFLSDHDFCQFTMASKKSYENYPKYKTILNQYHLNDICNVSQKFLFKNIIYDYLKWDINIVPSSINKITFIDEFNDEINDIMSLTMLNKIIVGMFFTNFESIIKLSHLKNYEKLLTFIVSNIVSINNNYDDVEIYFGRQNISKYPRTFGNRCRNNIWLRRINGIIKENIDNNIDDSKNTLENIIINLYIGENNLGKSKNTIYHVINKLSFIDIIYQIEPFKKYVEMYYDLTNKTNILELAIFLKRILKLNDNFISSIEKKLCFKHGVSKMGNYVSKITDDNILRRNNIIETNNII